MPPPLHHALPILLIAVAPLAARAARPTRLHVVRHAETVANQTGKYTKETLNVLSERGEEQRRQLTDRLLAQPKFDLIIVSPVPRAMMSIRPYLVASKAVAEIWPAIAECCHQKDKTIDPAALLPKGSDIKIKPEDAACFRTAEPDESRWYAPADYAQGIKQVEHLAAQIHARFSGSGKNVLLIGHGINGSLLIAKLLGRKLDLKVNLENAQETLLEETPGGAWRLVTHNGRPVKDKAPAPAAAHD